ncbi:nuclease-related domain-containing protein [Bacillaceae bacterium W0354]
MVIKDHDLPLKLWKLEALSERVLESHISFPEIEEALRIVRAGDRGERSIDYYIDLIDSDDLQVFYDVRLPWREHFFQMDTLLLTAWFILLLEIKNITGEIYFKKEPKQMLRILDGTTESFPDPLLQVYQQKFQLENFINMHGFPQIPIYSLVVFVNRNGILHIDPQDTFHIGKVIPVQEFIFKYRALRNQDHPQVLSERQLDKLSNILLNSHTPYDEDVLARFQLTEKELRNGVICPSCQRFGMIREWGGWLCVTCGAKSNNAHVKALRHYALLKKHLISNGEAREFLGVESREVSKYILSTLDVSKIGKGKGMKYDLSSLIDPQFPIYFGNSP